KLHAVRSPIDSVVSADTASWAAALSASGVRAARGPQAVGRRDRALQRANPSLQSTAYSLTQSSRLDDLDALASLPDERHRTCMRERRTGVRLDLLKCDACSLQCCFHGIEIARGERAHAHAGCEAAGHSGPLRRFLGILVDLQRAVVRCSDRSGLVAGVALEAQCFDEIG